MPCYTSTHTHSLYEFIILHDIEIGAEIDFIFYLLLSSAAAFYLFIACLSCICCTFAMSKTGLKTKDIAFGGMSIRIDRKRSGTTVGSHSKPHSWVFVYVLCVEEEMPVALTYVLYNGGCCTLSSPNTITARKPIHSYYTSFKTSRKSAFPFHLRPIDKQQRRQQPTAMSKQIPAQIAVAVATIIANN